MSFLVYQPVRVQGVSGQHSVIWFNFP